MREPETVRIAGTSVPVTRKRIRRVNLKVRADATIAVSAPYGYPLAKIQDFADEKSDWVEQRLARVATIRDREAEHWADGGSVSLLGTPLHVAHVTDAPTKRAQSVEREGDDLRIHLRADLEADERDAEARRLVEAWLKQQLAQILPDVFERLQERCAIHCSGWRIRRMKTRWGSCNTKTRMITINAQLVEYPIECLESVVVHELCHLLEPSHNARFHRLLDAYYPRNREARRILNATPPRR